MSTAASDRFAPDPQVWLDWGERLLRAGLAGGLVLVLVLAWHAPAALPLVPMLVAGAFAFIFLVQRPLLHLCVVLTGFAATLSGEDGLQVYEILYGLYYAAYLAGWFIYHGLLQQRTVFRDAVDGALVLFLVLAVASLGLTVLYGGSVSGAVIDLIPLSFLGFYFPIREALRNDPRAARWLTASFLLLVLIVLGWNYYTYFFKLQTAEYLWQVATGTVRINDRFLMVGAFFTLSFYSLADRWPLRLLLIGATALLIGGVIISQSRTVWVAMILGFGLLFFLVERHEKVRLILLATAGASALVLLGMILLDDLFGLVVAGIADRFTSLGTATTKDLSLVNRFVEWKAAFRASLESPILGHGAGVPYHFFNIISQTTQEKWHIHNTFLGLFYRHGLVGLGLVVFVLAVTWARGVRTWMQRQLPPFHHHVLIACLVALPCVLLAAMTEALFIDDAALFVVLLPVAMIAGLSRMPLSSDTRTGS